jgi:hypothetical protein
MDADDGKKENSKVACDNAEKKRKSDCVEEVTAKRSCGEEGGDYVHLRVVSVVYEGSGDNPVKSVAEMAVPRGWLDGLGDRSLVLVATLYDSRKTHDWERFLARLPAPEKSLVDKLVEPSRDINDICCGKESAINTVACSFEFNLGECKLKDGWSNGHDKKRRALFSDYDAKQAALSSEHKAAAEKEVRALASDQLQKACKNEGVSGYLFDPVTKRSVFCAEIAIERLTAHRTLKLENSEEAQAANAALKMELEEADSKLHAECKELAVKEARRLLEEQPATFLEKFKEAKEDLLWSPMRMRPAGAKAPEPGSRVEFEVFFFLAYF